MMPRTIAVIRLPPRQAAGNNAGAGDAIAALEWCGVQFPNADFVTIVCGVRNLPVDATVEWSFSAELDFEAVGAMDLGVLVAKGSPGSPPGTVTATVNGTLLEPIVVDVSSEQCVFV